MKKRGIIGAQLYGLREYTKNPKDTAVTFERIAKTGYKSVQISGIGKVSPEEIAKIAEDNDLIIGATHVPWNRFLTDLDRVIEEHILWKCKYTAIGGLPKEYFSLEGIERFIRELIPIAEKLAEHGMCFSYHNHNHELAKYNGKTWLERLFDSAEPAILKAEIDTYWIQAGGGDPAWWIKKYAGREPLLHLKDMAVTPEREQRYAELGMGNLNWDSILAAAEEAGVEYYLVEQDDYYERDPFEAMKISYNFLKSRGLN